MTNTPPPLPTATVRELLEANSGNQGICRGIVAEHERRVGLDHDGTTPLNWGELWREFDELFRPATA